MMNTSLKNKLNEINENHWDKWLKSKKKKSHIVNYEHSFVNFGMDFGELFSYKLGRSFDSSLGTLWEKILWETSVEYNDDTFSKNEKLVVDLKVGNKKWIVDLGFLRKNKYSLIELKLGGQLDNKKSKVEVETLKDRKDVLSEVVDKPISTYLGVVTNQLTDKPETWDKSTVLKEFSKDQLLIEKQLFDYVSGIDGYFEWIKSEIQPLTVNKWNSVKNEYKSYMGI